jgi:hypothetical protein
MAQAKNGTSIVDQLAGTYRDTTDRVFRIEQVGGRLLLRVGDQHPVRLMPSSNGVLSAQIPQIKVVASATEGPPAIALTQGGRTFEAIKLSEKPHG